MFDYCRPIATAIATVAAFVLTSPLLAAADDALELDPAHPADLLERFCFECHGANVQEANLRFDSLAAQSEQAVSSETLQKIVSVVREAAMPPEEADSPSDAQRAALIDWAEQQLQRLDAQAERLDRGTRNRRLTVEEYNFSLQTLFGVDAGFMDLLPPDPLSEDGYRNANERLGLSSLQIEAYLDSARRAVERYVRFGRMEQQPIRYFVDFEDLYYSTAERYTTRQRAPQPLGLEAFQQHRRANHSAAPKFVDALGPTPPSAFSDDEAWRAAIPKLHQQYIAIPKRLAVGELIIRVRAAGTADRDGRYPRLRVEAGITLGDGCSIDKRVIGEADVKASVNAPDVYEFRVRLEDVPSKGPLSEEETFDRLSVFDMDQIFLSNMSYDDDAVFGLGRGAYSDLNAGSAAIADALARMADDGTNLLHLDSIEIEMLPGVGATDEPYRWTVDDADATNEASESSAAAELLARFMRLAYRRPVAEEELRKKLELFRELRSQQYTFEESVRETLAAVLISPSFLFLESGSPQSLNASRLSYFLWLSPPDELLRDRAESGALKDRGILRQEAQRLLADARTDRFLESFCRQWLRMDRHATIAVDRTIYPTFDDNLASVSIRETVEFFADTVRSGGSALELLDSDYAILNDRLAQHYGIDGVLSGELQKVRLPDHSVRGGLLTQASLLTMNSDGRDSHPIRRGVWLLDRILGSPPPPPPPQVPGLDEQDPDLAGLSLKERIERHRQPNACQDCHRKIDPWGIALENFDAVGRWRDRLTSSANGDAEPRSVESATVLFTGEPIRGAGELKTHLVEQCGDQFANALVHHLLIYAIGRRPRYTESSQVEAIQAKFKESGYRIDELILTIIDSELFLPRASQTSG